MLSDELALLHMPVAVLTCALGTHKELICELHQACSNGNEGVDKCKLNV